MLSGILLDIEGQSRRSGEIRSLSLPCILHSDDLQSNTANMLSTANATVQTFEATDN